MSPQPANGIDRLGLDQAFEAEEILKSNLLLEARLLAGQQQPDAAAERFARAAGIEEHLSAACLEKGLRQKAWVHRYTAVSCWAQAGNFYQAIILGEQLLAEDELPARLRRSVQEFTRALRQRRQQWNSGLDLEAPAET
jgi:hypothetical protein